MAQIVVIPSAAACRAIRQTVGEVKRPVVERRQDVAVEIDHLWLSLRLAPIRLSGGRCKRLVQAPPRAGTRTTMIGMIMDLLPLGLRSSDGLQLNG